MSTSDILTTLHDALANSVNQTASGARPTALYLGHTEWSAYAHATEEEKDRSMYCAATSGQRPRYAGIPIYLVNAGSHLHFGFPPEEAVT